MKKIKGFFQTNWVYFAAFFLPVLLVFTAYGILGIHPFSSEHTVWGKYGSVLALDLNAQYIYFFEALRDAFYGQGSFFYNWSRNLSGGFAGIIGYYLASPFSIILLLLPRTMILESMLIMQLCKIGSAGAAFCCFLRRTRLLKEVRLANLPVLVFSLSYAMMSYAVIQTIDPMWLDGIVFLPLIAIGLERMIEDNRHLGYIIPLALMFIANFYIGYMIAIFVAVYFFVYVFCFSAREYNVRSFFLKLAQFAASTFVVLLLSAFMLLPVYNALKLGKFDFSEKDFSFATQFGLLELLAVFLPNQYYSVNVHGLPEVYCGVLAVALLPAFYLNKAVRRKTKAGCSILFFFLLFSMYVRPIDMLWHGGQAPNWLPYRYSFLLSFLLLTAAAVGFGHLAQSSYCWKHLAVFLVSAAAALFWFHLNKPSFGYIQDKFPYVASLPYSADITLADGKTAHMALPGTLLAGYLLLAAYLLLLLLYKRSRKAAGRNLLLGAILLILSLELCVNACDSFYKIHLEVAYSDGHNYYQTTQSGRAVTDKLYSLDDGFYRAEKTFRRVVNDNMAYRLRGITHSSSVMNAKALTFIETMGYEMQTFESNYNGNSMLSDSLLGIKYVISKPSEPFSSLYLNPAYRLVTSYTYDHNDGTREEFGIYENPGALSVGYMADASLLKLNHLGNDDPFNSQNVFMSTVAGNTLFETTPEGSIHIIENREYYHPLPVTVDLQDCYASAYDDKGALKYVAEPDFFDPVINIHFTAQSSDEIYMFLKTPYKEPVNTWISTEKDENGKFINHASYGTGRYFQNPEYGLMRMGRFEPGTDVELRLTLCDDDKDGEYFTILGNIFIYGFDEAAFMEDIEPLKSGNWEIEEYSERKLKGRITAGENQIMLLTIPEEPGWQIKVDGKRTETFTVLNTFLGIDLSPGVHTVEASYMPPGFLAGAVMFLVGLILCAAIFIAEKKGHSPEKRKAPEKQSRKRTL